MTKKTNKPKIRKRSQFYEALNLLHFKSQLLQQQKTEPFHSIKFMFVAFECVILYHDIGCVVAFQPSEFPELHT